MKKMGEQIVFVLLFFIFGIKLLQANINYEEAIFAVDYKRYSFDFIVYTNKESVFIPFEKVLSSLKIYYDKPENGAYEGYVNNSKRSFSVNFNDNNYRDTKGELHNLPVDGWFANEFQIYIRADLLGNIFNFRVDTKFSALSCRIKSSYVLPVMRAEQISKRSSKIKKKDLNDDDFGPIVDENSFTFLNGGMLDYDIGGVKTAANEVYDFNSTLGMEIMNGEFMYNLKGNVRHDEINREDRWRWRYLFQSDAIKYASLGNITNYFSRGGVSFGYRKPFNQVRGVSITNEDREAPNVFTRYVIEDRIQPEWTVELYIDGQLFDIVQTDANGYYRFEVPVSYGSTEISVKYYGTKGEFIKDNKVINIPSKLLPAGEFKYFAMAGVKRNTKSNIVDGTMYFGLTDWLTASVSGSKDLPSDDYLLVSRSSLNLFNNTMLNLLATNTGIYEASIQLPKKLISNLDIVYTYYDNSFEENKYNPLSRIAFVTTFNNIFSLPLTMSFLGSRDQYEFENNNSLNTNLSFNYAGFGLFVRHNLIFNDNMQEFYNFTQNSTVRLSYYINDPSGILFFLDKSRLIGYSNIDPKTLEIYSAGLRYNQSITKDISLRANCEYDIKTGLYQTSVGLNMNFPSFRSQSHASMDENKEIIYSGDLHGSIEFDSRNFDMNMVNSSSGNNFGRSSAAIRFYNDVNLNGKYDSEDKKLPDVDFDVTGNFVRKIEKNGYYVLSSLKPGKRYNVIVDKSSLPDQTLIPEMTNFSFIAEPYSYKSINIACQRGGMIEGNIKIQKDNKFKGQGGLKVHLKGVHSSFKKTVNVFSDGFYYCERIPAGQYIAYIDSSQLDILEVSSVPPIRNFVINPAKGDDIIGSINFKLFDKEKKATKLPSGLATSKSNMQNNNIANILMNFPDVIDISYSDQNQHEPDESSFGKLDTLALIMNYNSSFNACILEVNKFSNRGDFKERAEFIIGYLTSKGIEESRIKFQSQFKNKANTQKYNGVKSDDKNLKITLMSMGN